MKRIVYLAWIGSLALALTAWGAPKEKHGHSSARSGSRSPHVATHRSTGSHSLARAHRAPRSSHHVTATRPRSHVSQPRTVSRNRGAVAHRNTARGASTRAARAEARPRSPRVATSNASKANRTSKGRTARAEATTNRSSRVATEAGSGTGDRAALNREKNVTRANARQDGRAQSARAGNERVARATRNAARRNLSVNRQRNLTLALNVLHNRAGKVRITNNWRNAQFNNARYAAFHNYNRTWHDRGWWRNNHSHIVFVLGGWWYWNTGYWYPAWGYDPYGWYAYDGPIYTGYANVTPDQVIVDVQGALQDQGYYAGAIDGAIGPQTRAALAAFQADNGLAITSAVDQPTLETLGIA